MGRTLPTECDHGAIIDWGDFGPESQRPEFCPEQCADATQALWTWRASRAADFSQPLEPMTQGDVRAVLDRVAQAGEPGGLEVLPPGRFVRQAHDLACVPGRHDPFCNTATSLVYTDAHATGWDAAHASLCVYVQMGCSLHRNPYVIADAEVER